MSGDISFEMLDRMVVPTARLATIFSKAVIARLVVGGIKAFISILVSFIVLFRCYYIVAIKYFNFTYGAV